MIHLTDDGLQVTSTNPEAVTATYNAPNINFGLNNLKLTGTATYNSGKITLSAGSTLAGIDAVLGTPITMSALNADVQYYADSGLNTISTQGQFIGVFGSETRILNHGRCLYSDNFDVNPRMQLSAGTELITGITLTVDLPEVGVYAVNGTLINNNVAGSTFVSNNDGSIVYNGTTYAAGEFTIDAAGNGIGTVISADLAGDFLPNYDNEFTNALQIVDAGTSDNQLSEILPAENLGEVSFGTQTDELSQNPQIVIATEN